MKLAALQKKSSIQTLKNERVLVSAIAPATSPVFTRKYVAIAPTSGFARPVADSGAIGPSST